MTTQVPELNASAPEAPLTFQAPPPAAPGAPNPIARQIPWDAAITAETTTEAPK